MNCRWTIGSGVGMGLLVLACMAARATAETASPPAERPVASPDAAVAKTAATLDNLQAAWQRESRTKSVYEVYAAKAAEEGYRSVAVLFIAAAASENVHLGKHAAAIARLGGTVPKADEAKPVVRSTRENLEDAAAAVALWADAEHYPAFVKRAEADKDVAVVYSFKGALAAGAEHAKFFKQALKDPNRWKDSGKSFAVCTVCGFTVMGKPPAVCPVCSQPREKFVVYK